MAGGGPKSQQTIIIKRRPKAVQGGHHGGAWKVAYADFVTAMMAFFLLMWLLNATTEEQRKGLADYFNPSIPISKTSGGGQAALNGSTVLSEDTLLRDEIGASEEYPSTRPENPEDAGALEALQDKIEKAKTEGAAQSLADHIRTRMTPEGLLIELIDVDDDPLFALGSATPSKTLDDLLFAIAPVLGVVENKAAIVGHTDSLAFGGARAYSNWELSTDRAHASRRLLIAYGFPKAQVAVISGRADTLPISSDPGAPQNRRIAITLLHRTPTISPAL